MKNIASSSLLCGTLVLLTAFMGSHCSFATTQVDAVLIVPSQTVEKKVEELQGVIIESLELKDEIVMLKNNSQDLNMTGWKLISEVGGETYEFPQDYILKSETAIQVVSGRGKVGNGESILIWTNKNVWNNKGDACSLVDENGKEVFKFE